MPEQTDEFLPTRQSLLSRLKDWDDQESWREFFDLYGRLIYGLAVKCGLRDAEAQDVVQETLLTVAKKMPSFQYDPALGSFKGWLLQITRRRIADQFARRPPVGVRASACPPVAEAQGKRQLQQGEAPRTATVERVPDPCSSPLDAVWEEEWQRNLLEAAIQRVKRRVTPKQFQMFDLYVRQQWPMSQVTGMLNVNAAQVYMAKMRLSRMIQKEVRLLEGKGV